MAGYGTDEGFADWREANGYEDLAGDLSAAVLRQRGSDYIDSTYGARFFGVPTGGIAQERAWPRTGATAYGSSIPDDLIPLAVINASYAAAFQEDGSPGSLAAVLTPGARIKREKTVSLETEYFEGGSPSEGGPIAPIFSSIDGMLVPFVTPATSTPTVGLWAIGR